MIIAIGFLVIVASFVVGAAYGRSVESELINDLTIAKNKAEADYKALVTTIKIKASQVENTIKADVGKIEKAL